MKMKKNAGKITVAVLCLMACMIIAYVITPAFAIKRSYDQDVQTISMSTDMSGATDDMFTVTGGRIEIISLFGECTTSIGTIGNTDIYLDATAGAAYDRDFCTAVNIDALVAGGVVTFTNAVSEGVLTFVGKQGAGQTLSWFCSPGVIIIDPTTAASTGNITWYMSYRKLEAEAVVTAN